MHKEELSAALSRYHALGGDALLENFDYDPIPEGVYKRLEVAEELTKELMRQDQWMRLGRQPLTDCGIQFQLVFEGMFKDLKRKFEAHVLKIIMPVLQFPDSSYFCIIIMFDALVLWHRVIIPKNATGFPDPTICFITQRHRMNNMCRMQS